MLLTWSAVFPWTGCSRASRPTQGVKALSRHVLSWESGSDLRPLPTQEL